MSPKQDTAKPGRRIRIVPPVYLMASIVCMAVLHAYLPGAILLSSPWRWLGLAPLAAGLLFGGWAARQFAKHKTTIRPGEVSSSLLTSGPFSISRNPIYVGMTLVLVGVALLLGSATPWLMLPIFVAIIAVNIIPVEEAMMAEAFGADYQQYRAGVRRWI